MNLPRVCLLAAFGSVAFADQAPPPTPIDLGQASLEDLMDIKVTSASKKEEKLSRVAAAIFVISSEDIRRSGATNIPDLLRMAPGVDVEKINANAWAISIRGFNSVYANKVLVLIDGRTIYSSAFSGVYWEQWDLPLEDIERIEVIRGPGGTVWGANAVNGVISIITKSSKDTKGGLVTLGGGTQTKAVGEAQYGATLGPHATYRAFLSYFDIGNSDAPPGGLADDHWQRSHAGFRSDWDESPRDSILFEGDLYANQENQTSDGRYVGLMQGLISPQHLDAAGGNFTALWKHTLTGGSQTSLQAYFDDYRRTDLGIPAKTRTFDLDFQHHLRLGSCNDIVWGLGFRSDTVGLAAGYPVAFVPPTQTVSLFNVFLQDEIHVSSSFSVTLGEKLEHNSYTGFETEPSARITWSPPASHYTFWAAASQAIREPSRVDAAVALTIGTSPVSASSSADILLMGNPKIQAERLRDYEIGYRTAVTRTLSFDVVSFLSFYHHLESTNLGTPTVWSQSLLTFEVPALFGNSSRALDYGGELSVTWQAAPFWRITPGYALLHAVVRDDPGFVGFSADPSTEFPRHMVQARSILNLWRNCEFDQSLYYTARLPGGSIPGHARLDVRLGRRFGESTELSVVGQDLLRPRTLEYGDSENIEGMESVRSVYGKITWRF